MQNNILVSIVIPCYNSEKTIKNALESVLNQTYKHIEIVIVDGASKDNTLDTIRNCCVDVMNQVTIISEKDNGIYDAMNKGIKAAHGQLIGILSSNDAFEKDAVENIVNQYDPKYPICIIYGMQRYLRDGKEIYTAIYRHENLTEKMMAHPSCFVSKKLYEKYGAFDTSFKSSADYDFLWRMYEKSDVHFEPVYKIIANFNMGGTSGTQIGYLETIKLRYEKGQISKVKYKYIKFRCFISKIVRR